MVIDEREQVLDQGRYGTDTDGCRQMLAAGRLFPERQWAVEGSAGIGRHIAQRLVADGRACSTYRPSCLPECERLTPGRAARPTRSTRTASRWPGCAAAGCALSWPMTSQSRCGCWSTAATNSAAHKFSDGCHADGYG
jgi:hypothetical protein